MDPGLPDAINVQEPTLALPGSTILPDPLDNAAALYMLECSRLQGVFERQLIRIQRFQEREMVGHDRLCRARCAVRKTKVIVEESRWSDFRVAVTVVGAGVLGAFMGFGVAGVLR